MRRFKLSKVIVVTFAVFLLVVPLAGCAEEPLPVPPPTLPAGTISVQPAKIDQAMLKPLLPAVAKAAGLPEAAAAALPPCLSILAIPVKFSGSNWPANELVFIDLVIPPGVEVKGLTPGEDSVGIAVATADDAGNFEVTIEAIAKLNWLLNTDWLPTVKPDLSKIKPLPNGVYDIRATGVNVGTAATTTWELTLVAPAAPPAPPAPPAAPTEPGKLSFEAAEYTNAELGFSVKYPKDWAKQPSDVLLFYAASPAQVPVLFVDAKEGATFADALKASLEAAGGSGFKVVSEKETTLADGTKATEAAIEVSLRGFGAKGFALGAKKDNKWVLVTVGTVELLAKYDEAKFSEIVHTLQFKK